MCSQNGLMVLVCVLAKRMANSKRWKNTIMITTSAIAVKSNHNQFQSTRGTYTHTHTLTGEFDLIELALDDDNTTVHFQQRWWKHTAYNGTSSCDNAKPFGAMFKYQKTVLCYQRGWTCQRNECDHCTEWCERRISVGAAWGKKANSQYDWLYFVFHAFDAQAQSTANSQFLILFTAFFIPLSPPHSVHIFGNASVERPTKIFTQPP